MSIKKVGSLAKVGGTMVTLGGATIMTLVKGPVLNLPWTNTNYTNISNTSSHQDSIKGALMIITGCLGWAAFVILQVSILSLNILTLYLQS